MHSPEDLLCTVLEQNIGPLCRIFLWARFNIRRTTSNLTGNIGVQMLIIEIILTWVLVGPVVRDNCLVYYLVDISVNLKTVKPLFFLFARGSSGT